MLKDYPRFKRGEVESVYKNISNTEKKTLKEYLVYRKARGLNSDDKVNDVRRYLLHLRHILGKDFKKITLQEYREILALINSSGLSSNVKNHIKVDFKNFLKFLFPDWSMKFYGFEDVKLDSSRNEERINSHTIFSKEDITKLISHEPKLFWKTLLLLQYEGALRTIEVRTLEWDNIKFNVDGEISEINVYSTKTKKARTIFVKESTNLLKKLKEEQENEGQKGIYVFHARDNNDIPVNKAMVSVWFRRLTKRVLGREGWNYLLRHSKATELYRLANENKISKDIAIKFMGHSKDMSAVYTHLDKKDIQRMLKDQIYKSEELTPEEKDEMKKMKEKIELLSDSHNKLEGYIIELNDIFKSNNNPKKYLTQKEKAVIFDLLSGKSHLENE